MKPHDSSLQRAERLTNRAGVLLKVLFLLVLCWAVVTGLMWTLFLAVFLVVKATSGNVRWGEWIGLSLVVLAAGPLLFAVLRWAVMQIRYIFQPNAIRPARNNRAFWSAYAWILLAMVAVVVWVPCLQLLGIWMELPSIVTNVLAWGPVVLLIVKACLPPRLKHLDA